LTARAGFSITPAVRSPSIRHFPACDGAMATRVGRTQARANARAKDLDRRVRDRSHNMMRKLFALTALAAVVFAFTSEADAGRCRQRRNKCHRARHNACCPAPSCAAPCGNACGACGGAPSCAAPCGACTSYAPAPSCCGATAACCAPAGAACSSACSAPCGAVEGAAAAPQDAPEPPAEPRA
jgi:hypothetical protein